MRNTDERFSERENAIISIIGNKRMTIGEIAEKYDKGMFDANNKIAFAIRRINMKCEYLNLKWRIESEGGSGRGGKTVWIKGDRL